MFIVNEVKVFELSGVGCKTSRKNSHRNVSFGHVMKNIHIVKKFSHMDHLRT